MRINQSEDKNLCTSYIVFTMLHSDYMVTTPAVTVLHCDYVVTTTVTI